MTTGAATLLLDEKDSFNIVLAYFYLMTLCAVTFADYLSMAVAQLLNDTKMEPCLEDD